MDNKITKKRLSDLLTYDWLFMIIVCIAVIVVWELAYSIGSVKLTCGQQFKYYYDQNLSDFGDSEFYKLLYNDETFSFDIIESTSETLLPSYNVLNVRLSVQEGDVIFTDCVDNETNSCRAKTIIDNESVYTFDKLQNDGLNYLAGFLKDEFNGLSETERQQKVLDYNNLDSGKIANNFYSRMKKDNRFRNDSQKADGLKEENKRISKLCKEMTDFCYLMSIGESKDLFYKYTRYEQSINAAGSESSRIEYTALFDREKEKGRENAVYGLKIENLNGGLYNTSDTFKLREATDSKDIVLLVFDFYEYQPDLQFESVSFINTIVRNYSDLYNGR